MLQLKSLTFKGTKLKSANNSTLQPFRCNVNNEVILPVVCVVLASLKSSTVYHESKAGKLYLSESKKRTQNQIHSTNANVATLLLTVTNDL